MRLFSDYNVVTEKKSVQCINFGISQWQIKQNNSRTEKMSEMKNYRFTAAL